MVAIPRPPIGDAYGRRVFKGVFHLVVQRVLFVVVGFFVRLTVAIVGWQLQKASQFVGNDRLLLLASFQYLVEIDFQELPSLFD